MATGRVADVLAFTTDVGMAPALEADRIQQNRPPFDGDLDAEATSPALAGTLTVNLPVSESVHSWGGELADSYRNDFYYRIHFIPNPAALGNVVGVKVTEVLVWNSFFVVNTLAAITGAMLDGVTIANGAPPPTDYGDLAWRRQRITAQPSGPPLIAGAFLFSFGQGAASLPVSGARIMALDFPCNWAEPVTERVEFLTGVIEARDGGEQRWQLREKPRRGLAFTLEAFSRDDRARLERVLWSWGALPYAVPFWPDLAVLQAPLAQGATVIPVTTATRDYEAGGLAFLTDLVTWEFLQVDTVAAGSVTLKIGTSLAWPAGTRVIPGRTGYLSPAQGLNHYSPEIGGAAVSVRFLTQDARPAVDDATLYRGYGVLQARHNWNEGRDETYSRKVELVDFGVGDFAQDDLSQLPSQLTPVRWFLHGRAAIDEFRGWLYRRAGRFVPFWLASEQADMIPAQAIVIDANLYIYTAGAGYGTHFNLDPGRRDLQLVKTDGTTIRRRITGFTSDPPVPAGQEKLTVDTNWPSNVNLSDVERIEFLALARLDADSVEISWHSVEMAEVTALVRVLRDDL